MELTSMKFSRISMFALWSAIFVGTITAQDSHVNTVYVEEAKKTVISTDRMYVVNSPEQFVQMMLSFRYSGRQMTKMPDKVDVMIWALTKKLLYEKDTNRKLYLVADGERVDSTPTRHLVLNGEAYRGQDTFFTGNREGPQGIGLQIPIPPHAQVRSGDVGGLYMEQMYTNFKPKDLARIIAAKEIQVFLGKQKIALSENQLSTLRELARRLNP